MSTVFPEAFYVTIKHTNHCDKLPLLKWLQRRDARFKRRGFDLKRKTFVLIMPPLSKHVGIVFRKLLKSALSVCFFVCRLLLRCVQYFGGFVRGEIAF